MDSLTATIEQIGNEFEKFANRSDDRQKEMRRDLEAMDKKLSRMELPPAGRPTGHLTGANNEHTKAFDAWARHGNDPDGLQRIQASMKTLSDPDGGYLIPVELDNDIDRLAEDTVAMRRLATVITRKGEYKKPFSMGSAGGGWVGEVEARSETDTPELKMFAPAWCEVYANPKVSQKLLDMSDFDLFGWLSEEVGAVFTSKEGEAFITGDGSGKPRGIISEDRMVANASWEFGKTGYVVSGHASLLNSADALVNLQHALKAQYRRNGVFLMNDTTLSVIRRLKDGLGNYIWMPGLMENSPDLLLGRPVEIDENMPDIGTDDYPIAFGDFKAAYRIIDHQSGTCVLRDPYTEKGQVFLYTVKRVAAGVSNFEALKFLKISA